MKITQLGKALDKEKYVIDEKSKSLSTTEDNLVLDFSDEHGWVFKTGYYCTFDTGYNCTFNTGYYCTFNTGYYCTFNTGSNCTFDTGYYCTFKTGSECVAVRRDIYEVIEIPKGKTIRLNGYGVKGYVVVEEPEPEAK